MPSNCFCPTVFIGATMSGIEAKKLEIEENRCRVALTEMVLRQLGWRNWNLKEEKKELEKELKELKEWRRRSRRRIKATYHRLMDNYRIHLMDNYHLTAAAQPVPVDGYFRPQIFQVPRTPPPDDGSEDASAHVKERPELSEPTKRPVAQLDLSIPKMVVRRARCQCGCGCRKKPGQRRQCQGCGEMVGPCCLIPGYDRTHGLCHMCDATDEEGGDTHQNLSVSGGANLSFLTSLNYAIPPRKRHR